MAIPVSYPQGVRVFIDDEDITYPAFGVEVLTLSDVNRIWRDIDIAQYLHAPGVHKLTVTATSGVGRVEARVSLK